ncbi:MAG: hypothetical protein CMB26_04135 [Euryarchaeota archaeon]|nr:hypothetical protein [Euryarchaeota archaeon]DAC62481.1 MAG TPA: hypothetical protein D7I10_03935 [Candidatus Poseidoniales archaeon]HIH81573.1 hypothetical protein [Candidatus Thalassarchaeaceae archaeon]
MVAVEEIQIQRIVADGDLDGLLSAAILKRVWNDAEVQFSHPAEIRRGDIDDFIHQKTAVVDLPFHPNCGLHIDHHLTNKPTELQILEAEARGCKIIWDSALSAARVCFDTFREIVDLSDIEQWMDMVDKLDGGKISREEFLSNHPIVWIGRIMDASEPELCALLLTEITDGASPDVLINVEEIHEKVRMAKDEFTRLQSMIDECSEIDDRMAIVRLDGKGIRTNGYLITAHFGGDCDACIIIHGDAEPSEQQWPLSASFYSNSFLHKEGGLFDLTTLATAFDVDGGGHANACGCRIQPLSDTGIIEKREVETKDIDKNLDAWMREWRAR